LTVVSSFILSIWSAQLARQTANIFLGTFSCNDWFWWKYFAYLIIHKCEKEHKCRSVRDDESDSENVRLWLCRIVDDVPAVDDDDDDVEGFVVVDVALALVLEDEFAVTVVRLLLLLLSILSELINK